MKNLLMSFWRGATEEPVAELRSCVIVRRGGKFCLLTRDRSRTLGCHDTYREAAAQEKAIEISKARRGAAEWNEADHPRDDVGRFVDNSKASRGRGVGPVAKNDWDYGLTEAAFEKSDDSLFRGISQEELDFIERTGEIKSNESYCVPGEGTCFDTSFGSAESYVNYGHSNPARTGKPNYVIEVSRDSGPKVDPRDGYYKAPSVPASHIRRIWKFDPEGRVTLHGRRSATEWDESKHPRDDDGRWVSTGAALGSVYHGGKTKITEVDPSKLQSRDYGFYGEGFYVTSVRDYAKAYGGKVSEFKLDPDATVLMASLKPEDAPAGLVDEVFNDAKVQAWDRAVARGKTEALIDELNMMRTDPLAWKQAVSAYAKRKDFAVVHFSSGEIVVRHHKKLRSAEWREEDHPRDDDGKFTDKEFPFADEDENGVAPKPDTSHQWTNTAFDNIHGFDDPAVLKRHVSQNLARALDEEFDSDKLRALADLLGSRSNGDTYGYDVSAAFVDGWAMSSGDSNPLSIAYQHAANEAVGADGVFDHFGEFGGGPGLAGVLAAIDSELGLSDGESHGITAQDVFDMMHVHARAQYQETQKTLKMAGVKEVSLYRGVLIEPEHAAEIARTGVAALQPLSSFSSSRDIALDFAGGSQSGEYYSPTAGLTHGHILRVTLPASRVFSIPKTGFGCREEHEWVVLGTKSTKVRISKRYGRFHQPKTNYKPPTFVRPLDEDTNDPAFTPFSEAYGRMAAWDESEHPREPKGTSEGGQFTSGDVGEPEIQHNEYSTDALFRLPDDAGHMIIRLKASPELYEDEDFRTPAGYAGVSVVKVKNKGRGDGFKLYKAAFEYVRSKGMHGLASHVDFRTDDGQKMWDSLKRHGAKVSTRGNWTILQSLGPKARSAKYNPDQPREPRGDPEGGQWVPISGRARRGDMRPATRDDRKRLGVPPAYTDVEVTDDPNADLIGTARNSKGKLVSYYSERWHEQQSAKKWARISALNDALPAMLDQVNADIADRTEDRDVAMTIRLIAQTGMRNGGDAGEGIGASNLRMNHITVTGNSVRLQFKGKGGVAQDHTVIDKVFANYVRERRAAGAKGDDRLFEHTSKDTLDYQKRIGGGKFKVHDLRTYVGTTTASKLAQDLIAGGGAPTTAKELKAAVKAIAVTVSRKLGNTPSIALSTYIHPAAIEPLSLRVVKAGNRGTKPRSRR